jgi:hypothetical protein
LVPTRQQTLLAALDWSHDLLSPDEQKVFRRLGVFAGDFSLELATAVARDAELDDWAVIDALGALVDRSLVEVDAAAVPRYRLLESARAYALLKLPAQEAHATNRALANTLLAIFEGAERESWSWIHGDWVAAYGGEIENMRAALDWSMEHDRPLAMALLGNSRFLHSAHSLDFELRVRCEKLQAAPLPQVSPRVEADYYHALAWTLRFAKRERALGSALRAAELYRELGDDMMRCVALTKVALVQDLEHALATASVFTALQRPDWPPRVKYAVVTARAFIALREANAQADALLEQGLECARQCGSDNLVRRMLGNIADRALFCGDVEKAVRMGRELVVKTPERHYHVLIVRGNLANALLHAGQVESAREVMASYLDLSRVLDWDTFTVFAPVMALLAASEARYETAARLIGYADRWAEEVGDRSEDNERRSRRRALTLVEEHIEPAAQERLLAEGAALDEEGVCALVLEPPPARAVTKQAAKPTLRTARTPSS